jgi:uncharacterized protein YcbK (DUF882 family)
MENLIQPGEAQLCLDRRQFLKMGSALTAGLGLSMVAGNLGNIRGRMWERLSKSGVLTSPAILPLGHDAPPVAGALALNLYNIHTGEYLKTTYWEDGKFIPEALDHLNHFLRDYRTNQVLPMDPQLMTLVHKVGQAVDARQPVHVISGYRSPKTNAMLAAEGHGVATKSMHILGRAMDIFVPGRSLRELHEAALKQHAGGVGYYPKSNFVHVDTGRVRHWNGV